MANVQRRTAMQHVHMLSSEIGPRPIGSAANAVTADYIERTFQILGLQTHRQEFHAPSWTLGRVSRGSLLARVAVLYGDLATEHL